MSVFHPFTPEESEIILSALRFAKEIILQYHSNWLRDSPPINHAEIDQHRATYGDSINYVIELIEDPRKQNRIMRSSEIHNINEVIGSSLSIFLQEINKAIDPRLPRTKLRASVTQRLLDNNRFFQVQGNLLQAFYDGYGIIKSGDKKLIFFSYSTKDKSIVGKICKELESEYGFSVFRAHDNIEVNAIWREEIKRNLDKCDGLVSYVSRPFRHSEWTLQECGWVLGRKIPIFSLFKMKKRPGFLEERQGMNISETTSIEEMAKEISEYFA